MENYAIVRSEHLNHYGFLFGGQTLSWVDEFAWIAASRQFPGKKFVTRAMDEIEFKTGVQNGSILRFDVKLIHKGASSVKYSVEVYAEPPNSDVEIHVFSNQITFVCVDDQGNKCKM